MGAIVKRNEQQGVKVDVTLESFTSVMEEVEEQPAWRARADRESDYFDGNQLDSDILLLQEENGIPSSIENLIGRTIRDILGIESKNRKDFKVLPEAETGADDLAEAMSQKLNKAERESKADKACSKAHAGQVKVGLGWVEVARETDPFKFPYRCKSIHRNEIWWDMKSKEPVSWWRRSASVELKRNPSISGAACITVRSFL